MEACNCEFQSGLCGFCAGQAVAQIRVTTYGHMVDHYNKQANAMAVKLATKRVGQDVRDEWTRRMNVARYHAEALAQFDQNAAMYVEARELVGA